MTKSYVHTLILAACCSALPLISAQAAFEFIPAPSRAPAASGLPNGVPPASVAAQGQTEMTPAPAASVVSEALLEAQSRTSPQSLLPPAPAAPQYNLVPASIAQNTAVKPTINMNPLASAAVPANGIGQLEEAMTAGAIMPAAGSAAPASMAVMPSSSGRSSIGSMPLPPAAPLAPVASAAAPNTGGQYGEAVGFGKDLPLALAVSQIVPPDYAFSFSNAVNPGDLVSWEGGKSWNTVLTETLGAVGASASIDEAKKEITIVSGATAPVPASFGLMTPAAAVSPAAPSAPAAALPTPRPPMVSANTPLYSPASAITPEPVPVAAIPAFPVAQAVSPAAALPAAMTASPAVSQPKMQLAGVGGSTVMDPKQKDVWEAPRGATLRQILTDWSQKAGVELFWSSDFDFPVSSALHINGTYEEAVQMLLSGLRDAQPRPIGRLHPNLPDGPSVLVVETKHTIE